MSKKVDRKKKKVHELDAVYLGNLIMNSQSSEEM